MGKVIPMEDPVVAELRRQLRKTTGQVEALQALANRLAGLLDLAQHELELLRGLAKGIPDPGCAVTVAEKAFLSNATPYFPTTEKGEE